MEPALISIKGLFQTGRVKKPCIWSLTGQHSSSSPNTQQLARGTGMGGTKYYYSDEPNWIILQPAASNELSQPWDLSWFLISTKLPSPATHQLKDPIINIVNTDSIKKMFSCSWNLTFLTLYGLSWDEYQTQPACFYSIQVLPKLQWILLPVFFCQSSS